MYITIDTLDICQEMLDKTPASDIIGLAATHKRNGGLQVMVISYKKLWKLMIDQNLNKTQLKDKAQISTNAVAKLGKNESVSMDTLEKICRALRCDIGDIMEFIDEDKKERK